MWGEQRYGEMQSPVRDSLAALCQKWKENKSSEMTLLTTGPYCRLTQLHQAERYLSLREIYWHRMDFQINAGSFPWKQCRPEPISDERDQTHVYVIPDSQNGITTSIIWSAFPNFWRLGVTLVGSRKSHGWKLLNITDNKSDLKSQ